MLCTPGPKGLLKRHKMLGVKACLGLPGKAAFLAGLCTISMTTGLGTGQSRGQRMKIKCQHLRARLGPRHKRGYLPKWLTFHSKPRFRAGRPGQGFGGWDLGRQSDPPSPILQDLQTPLWEATPVSQRCSPKFRVPGRRPPPGSPASL